MSMVKGFLHKLWVHQGSEVTIFGI